MDEEKKKAIISDAFLAKLMGGDYKTMFDDTMLDHHCVSYTEMNDFLHEVIPILDETYERYEEKVFEAADSLSEGVLQDLQKKVEHKKLMLDNYAKMVRHYANVIRDPINGCPGDFKEEFEKKDSKATIQMLKEGVTEEEIAEAKKMGYKLSDADMEWI